MSHRHAAHRVDHGGLRLYGHRGQGWIRYNPIVYIQIQSMRDKAYDAFTTPTIRAA